MAFAALVAAAINPITLRFYAPQREPFVTARATLLLDRHWLRNRARMEFRHCSLPWIQAGALSRLSVNRRPGAEPSRWWGKAAPCEPAWLSKIDHTQKFKSGHHEWSGGAKRGWASSVSRLPAGP